MFHLHARQARTNGVGARDMAGDRVMNGVRDVAGAKDKVGARDQIGAMQVTPETLCPRQTGPAVSEAEIQLHLVSPFTEDTPEYMRTEATCPTNSQRGRITPISWSVRGQRWTSWTAATANS